MPTYLANTLSRALTVAQLREQLESLPPDMPVLFSYNYGDHWRTEVAQPVCNVDETEVCWSEYHQLPKLVDAGSADTTNCIILSV